MYVCIYMVNKCYKKTKKSFKRKEEKGTKISLKKKKKHQHPRDRDNFLGYSRTKFKKYFNI